VAVTKQTRQEDQRLKEELKNADLERFKRLIKSAFVSPERAKKKPA